MNKIYSENLINENLKQKFEKKTQTNLKNSNTHIVLSNFYVPISMRFKFVYFEKQSLFKN